MATVRWRGRYECYTALRGGASLTESVPMGASFSASASVEDSLLAICVFISKITSLAWPAESSCAGG